MRAGRSLLMALCVVPVATPLAAQTVVLDEGTFRLQVAGKEVGTETFTIRQNGTGDNADPDDDKYLAAAIEGRASFVVTGDRDLLAVTRHAGVRILAPRAFPVLLEG